VALLHGLFGMGSNLGGLARSLQDDFAVLGVDLPNHGRSQWMHDASLDLMAQTVSVELRALNDRPWWLVGHSLGGKVAMQMALDDSSRVAGLVVADIAPVAYPPRHERVFAALHEVERARPRSRQAARLLLHAQVDEPGVADFLGLSLEEQGDGSMGWRFNLAGLERNYPQFLAAPRGATPYHGPTLFIKGERSDYMQPEHTPMIRALFPRARIHQIAGAGHWLHAEKPARFATLVRNFLLEAEQSSHTAEREQGA